MRSRLRLKAFQRFVSVALSAALVLSAMIELLLLPAPASAASETKVFQEGLDGYAGNQSAHVTYANPDNNFGTNDRITLYKNLSQSSASFLQFNLSSIPKHASIDSATLELTTFGLGSSSTGAKVAIHRVTAPWDEATITWNNSVSASVYDPTPVTVQSINGYGANSKSNLDLTTLVQQWFDGTADNNGFMLQLTELDSGTSWLRGFHSDDSPTQTSRPKLTISYTYVPTTGVVVTPDTLSLVQGGSTGQLSANVQPNDASNKNVQWASSDTAIATVDASGRVTPVGLGTATITATTEDGNWTDSSTVTVTSNNADLSSLVLSQGTLSPAFASGVTGYSATLANSVMSVNITPTAADAKAVITVNGQIVESGNPTAIPLSVGNNIVKVLVTAEDGRTQKLYTATITRPPSMNADLSDLALSDGGLSPAFSSGTLSYHAAVGYDVTGISVTPTAADTNSTLTVNGQTVASGSASASIPLSVGLNTIRVTVTAQDGTTRKSYTLKVSRAANNDARLTDLKVSEGSLAPVFDWSEELYRVSVDQNVTSINVTPTAADSNATVTVNDTTVSSGSASANIPLNVGANEIKVKVTAQDGNTTKTYTITVTRAKSTNANLNNLTLSTGLPSPAFASGMTAYTTTVSNSVNSLTVTPFAADSNAAIEVNGTPVTSGMVSQEIPLDVGDNSIQVTVTAQDGITTKTYTVTVRRAPIDSADLKNLTLSDGILSPSFDSGVTDYQTMVWNSVNSLTITPTTADPNATVSVNGTPVASGTASPAIPLDVGDTLITMVVTGQGGMTKTYTVTVTRAVVDSDDLRYLTLSDGSLNPAFVNGVTDYTATVASNIVSVKVTPWTADPSATVTVNGKAVVSGAPSGPIPLNAGENTIEVTVTAATQKTYIVKVTRAARVNADLSNLSLSSGSLSPAFAGGVINYTATVANEVTNVTVSPTSADPNATLSVNGTVVASAGASPSISLNIGNNTIMVKATAEDGTTSKTHTVVVTRMNAATPPSGSDSGNDPAPSPEPKPTTPEPTEPPEEEEVETEQPPSQPSDEPAAAECPKLSWSDVQNHWAKSSIEAASQLCAVYGVSSEKYVPNGGTTRLEFALMISRALKLQNMEILPAPDTFKDWDDVPKWALAELPAAIHAGIIVGYDDNSLRPNKTISRAEMVSMLIRGMGVTATAATTSFTDDTDIPRWAKGSVAKAAEIGIIVGRSNNRFEPSGMATRAEAAVVLVNMLAK